MNKSPLVSVLMPVYNAEKYLKTAIDGILAQTFTDFELIAVNDGSADNSEEIILSYKDERIKYYKQENQGVARTLNNGLNHCRGKYIRRHDADDLSTPNSLKEQVDFMEKHPEYALVSSQIAFMTSSGKIAYNHKNPSNDFFKGEKFIEITKDNYWENRPIIHATVLAKKELFNETGGYRTEFPTSEDIDLWLRILEKHKAAVINRLHYFVRLHQTSNTKLHGSKNAFYRNLAYDFFKNRKKTGSDPLMRGEPMPKPPEPDYSKTQKQEQALARKGKLFRGDILNYRYKIFTDAKDRKLVRESVKTALKDGWKLKQTWKAILFPLLGEKMVSLGVKIKSVFK